MARSDEIGGLTAAVDRMADDLRERELRLETEQIGQAYRDKMTALGAFASGVAHEVNNPLTSIAAQAQSLVGTAHDAAARAILDEVGRAAVATRKLAAMGAVQPGEYEWIDLDDLVRRTVGLLTYDRRYRLVPFATGDLGRVAAIRTVPDRLQQALSLCLSDAADRPAEHGGNVSIALAALQEAFIARCSTSSRRPRGRTTQRATSRIRPMRCSAEGFLPPRSSVTRKDPTARSRR